MKTRKFYIVLILSIILIVSSVSGSLVLAVDDNSAETVNTEENYYEEDADLLQGAVLADDTEAEQTYDEDMSSDAVQQEEIHKETPVEKTDPAPAVTEDNVSTENVEQSDDYTYSSGELTATSGNYEITLSYGEEANIPDDAQLSVNEIKENSDEYNSYVENAAASVFEGKDTVADSLPYARFFDITIIDSEGNAIEPAAPVSVVIDLKDDALSTEDVDFTAVHFNETESGSGNIESTELINIETENMGTPKAESQAAFEAESFSVYGVVYYYTVDFYYIPADAPEGTDPSEYHMNGGSEMMLSELFDRLGISKSVADITKVDFTNTDLVSFTKEGSDWKIKSHQPFTSSELLTITFADGTIIEIGVEDAVGPNSMNGERVRWQITDAGVLRIYPSDGVSGRISNSYAQGAGGPSSTTWPWKNYASQIKEVVIEGEIGTYPNMDLNYMFANCPNLEKVDLSGLVQTNPGGSQQADGHTTRNLQGMFLNCKKLTLDNITGLEKLNSPRTTDISQMFRGSGVTEVTTGADGNFPIETDNITNMARLFSECTSLVRADLGGFKNNKKMENMQNLFNGCSSLEEVIFNNPDFESRGNAAWGSGGLAGGISGMFTNCNNLKKVDMSNITLHFRPSDESFGDAFRGKNLLHTVIMENATFVGVRDLFGAFSYCPNLTYVNMSGDTGIFPDAVSMMYMFEDSFTNPQPEAKVTLDGQPNGNYAVLDVSGFGEMKHIVNMDNFVNNCSGLDVLNITGMDNSRIQPHRPRHPAADVDPQIFEPGAIVAYSYGREYKLETCTNLKWILAEGSKVWMTTNSKGYAGGSPYFAAQTDNEIYYFTTKQIDYYASGTTSKTVTLESKRDYIDMMTDREAPDPGNDNAKYDINKQNNGAGPGQTGAGMLPAGNFYLTDKAWVAQDIPTSPTYYRIGNMENSTPKVTINATDKFEEFEPGKIDTPKLSNWPIDGDFTYAESLQGQDPLIQLVYPAAAVDVNGKYHDVIVKITKVVFTNLGALHEDPPTTHDHDPNRYLGTNNTYFRPILEYGTGHLAFKNYVWDDPQTNRKSFIKGESGTEIDFSIEIKDALPDTSVLFFIDDLDVPAKQTYVHGDDPDGIDCWCYDYLPWENVDYDDFSEGIVLGDGNDMTSVRFAEHTGMKNDGNYIHGTGTDPSAQSDILISSNSDTGSTYWSGFSVKANSDKASYTWKTGIGCTTELLRETPAEPVAPVTIDLSTLKTINNKTPEGTFGDRYFEFTLSPAAEFGEKSIAYTYFDVDDGNANQNKQRTHDTTLDNLAGKDPYDKTNRDLGTANQTEKNNAQEIPFKSLKFAHPKATTFDNNNGMTGANSTNKPDGTQYRYDLSRTEYDDETDGRFKDPTYTSNLIKMVEDRGYNEHIANAYIYRIKETIPTNSADDVLEYNTRHVTYFLKVIVSDPKNDYEMGKGVRADVTIGAYYGNSNADLTDPLNAAQIAEIEWGETQTIWSSDSESSGKRMQEPRKVWYPQEGDPDAVQYQVMIDKNGVEYIAIDARTYYNDPTKPAGDIVYLDANDPYKGNASILIETVPGQIYPYAAQDSAKQIEIGHEDKAVMVQKKNGDEDVKMDVHGEEYYGSGGSYSKAVKDGVFNPDDASDRKVYEQKTVTVGGNDLTVYEDTYGNEYCYDPSTDKYYDTNGQVVSTGTIGDVIPGANDQSATQDKIEPSDAIFHINGNIVKATEVNTSLGVYASVHYYKDGNTYYSVVGTPLTPNRDGFYPDDLHDAPHTIPFDIMEDENGDYYYIDGGDPYIYDPNNPNRNGQSYDGPGSTGDKFNLVHVGAFNNRIKTSDITLTKRSVDGDKNENAKSDLFSYNFEFPGGFEMTDYAFSTDGGTTIDTGGPDNIVTGSNGKYTVTLHEGQTFIVYNVPFQTTYKITEGIDLPKNNNGWEFVSATEWDDVQEKQVETYRRDRNISGVITEERYFAIDTTIGGTTYNAGDPNPEYKGQYDHTYRNRFTEMVLKKEVTAGDKNEPFSFTAEVTNIPQSAADTGFSYGWMDEDNNQNFQIAPAGTTSVTITPPALKHGEDAVLVFPYGSTVVIKETNNMYDATWEWKDNNGTEISKGNAEVTHPETSTAELTVNSTNKDISELTFKNKRLRTLAVKKSTAIEAGGASFTFRVSFNGDGTMPEPTPEATYQNTLGIVPPQGAFLVGDNAWQVSIAPLGPRASDPFLRQPDYGYAIFDHIPEGTRYQVWELEKEGWQLYQEYNTSGTVPNGNEEVYAFDKTVGAPWLNITAQYDWTIRKRGGEWVNERYQSVPLPSLQSAYNPDRYYTVEANKWYEIVRDSSSPTGWKYVDTGDPILDGVTKYKVKYDEQSVVEGDYILYNKKITGVWDDTIWDWTDTDPEVGTVLDKKIIGRRVTIADFWNMKTVDLGIEKEIAGNMGDKEDIFHFTFDFEAFYYPVDVEPELQVKMYKAINTDVPIDPKNPSTYSTVGDVSLTYKWVYRRTINSRQQETMYDTKAELEAAMAAEEPLNPTKIVVYMKSIDKINFELGHKGKVLFTDLPYGVKIKVKETDAKSRGYTPYFDIDGYEDEGDTFEYFEPGLLKDYDIKFINVRNGVIPTEIHLGRSALLTIPILALIAGIVLLFRRMKRI